ncbi:MAG TPA: hypothetical protein VH518_08895, partial [Tepidisphaeraceae bacterium]
GMTVLQAIVLGGINPPDAMDKSVLVKQSGAPRGYSTAGRWRIGQLMGREGNRELHAGDSVIVGTSPAPGAAPPPGFFEQEDPATTPALPAKR